MRYINLRLTYLLTYLLPMGQIVLQRQTVHADASWARSWWKSHYFHCSYKGWKLSTVKKVCSRVDRTHGSAVLRNPGTGRPATLSACAVCRSKTIFYPAWAYWRAILIIANVSVRLSVCYVPVSDENGITYRQSFFSPYGSPISLVSPALNIFTKFRRCHSLRGR